MGLAELGHFFSINAVIPRLEIKIILSLCSQTRAAHALAPRARKLKGQSRWNGTAGGFYAQQVLHIGRKEQLFVIE